MKERQSDKSEYGEGEERKPKARSKGTKGRISKIMRVGDNVDRNKREEPDRGKTEQNEKTREERERSKREVKGNQKQKYKSEYSKEGEM